jgi:imidazolonepropionase
VPSTLSEETVFSANGNVVIPGLVDCHTHLCFGGWRADEFEQRIQGVNYLDIAREGGGIRKTMRQTREATEETLTTHGLSMLAAMSKLGVTTVECKSGYGLSTDAELRLLRVYRHLRGAQELDIVSTFMGAHIVPPEHENDRERYIDLLCDEMIPAIAEQQLAEFCDVFVEDSAFSRQEATRILRTGQAHGLRSKLHVDQLSDGQGAALSADLDAVSADHLEYTSDAGMQKMAEKGVIGVCLPLATLYLDQKPMEARRFVQSGVKVAVATDFNPGSAPSYDLPLAMMLSCTMNRLTPAEALKGATVYAAAAIGREHLIGSIEVGKRADFALLDVPNVNHWLYHFRPNACTGTFIRGIAHS